MKIDRLAAVLAAALSCAGCASVVDGTTQPIYVSTAPEVGAACTCSNDQGKWSLVTPGSVVIHRSQSVLKIRCTKAGMQDGTFYAAGHMSGAATVGMMMPYVGLLSAAADASSGAGTIYPDSYVIVMKPTAPASSAAAPPPPPPAKPAS
jgi:hypothetical protein